eukprot:g43195.t1
MLEKFVRGKGPSQQGIRAAGAGGVLQIGSPHGRSGPDQRLRQENSPGLEAIAGRQVLEDSPGLEAIAGRQVLEVSPGLEAITG